MINVAIIGNNFGTRVHLPAFKLIEDVNISTICSNHNWLDIMQDKNIDAICLSVPPTVSYEILQSAISHKKHIFCEKPLACNLTNAANISGLLNNDIITAINFEICESRIVKKFKALIDSKPFGNIKNINLKWIAKNNNHINHSWKHNL
jgi:predicted dehydrogenase